jgi:superfamily II DNA or RNA helicase
VEQTRETLIANDIPENEIGFIKAGYKPLKNEQVAIASIQTLARRNFPPDIGLVIVDEAHTTCFYNTYAKIQDFYQDSAYFIGLTASPWRNKSTECMEQWFDELVIVATIDELIEKGNLVKPRYFGFGGNIDFSKLETGNDGDYKAEIVQSVCNEEKYNDTVVEKFLQVCPNRTGIVFCASVKQSRLLAQKFNEKEIVSEHIEAATPIEERNEIFNKLKNKEIQLICSVGTLTEGFDVKSIDCVVIARPTRSFSLLVQVAGRGLRPYPEKEDCFLLDFGENFNRLGFLNNSKYPPTLKPIKQQQEPPTKECPSCHAILNNLVQICPECGYEFPPPEEKLEPELDLETEFGELFDEKTKEKIKYLRQQIRRAYKQGKSRDRIAQNFIKRYNEQPNKKWWLGAIFGGKTSNYHKRKFLDYLYSIKNPAPKQWLEKHFRLEFGSDSIQDVQPTNKMQWWEVLQVSKTANLETIKESYKKLAKKHHPDIGGSEESMKLLNWALDKAKTTIDKTKQAV